MDIFQAIFKNYIVNDVDIPISPNILNRLNEIDPDSTFEDITDPYNL